MLEPRPRKLLDQVRGAVRVKRYSCSTEKTYVYWIRRFIFHNKRHPNEMDTLWRVINSISWNGALRN